ncbi:MAG TPA: hypothetical protein VJ952_01245 [Opitutales bacterium]|nr:hypothetical protein [Opitutales bacterium]
MIKKLGNPAIWLHSPPKLPAVRDAPLSPEFSGSRSEGFSRGWCPLKHHAVFEQQKENFYVREFPVDMQPFWLHLLIMASITLKNIPEHLHLTYKRRARQHARSLQAEILHTLGESAEVLRKEPLVSVDEVAGCIKPGKPRASLSEMDRGVDAMFREQWKRKA